MPIVPPMHRNRPHRHQLRTYTKNLLKDTETMLKDLVSSSDDRHLKIQKDRLVDELTAAVSAFQAVQKKTFDIEQSQYRQARSQNVTIPKPPGSQSGNNSAKGSFFMETFSSSAPAGQMQQQLQEDIDLHALEEQERTIRELEVTAAPFIRMYSHIRSHWHHLITESISLFTGKYCGRQ